MMTETIHFRLFNKKGGKKDELIHILKTQKQKQDVRQNEN